MRAGEKPPIAIIGTGLSGLACADGLGQDFELSLFDKSRGLSGRLSTRRATPHVFDHGAQYFRADSAGFQNWLQPFEAAGHVQRWHPRHVRVAADGTPSVYADAAPKWVFTPGMSAIGKALVAGRPHWKLYLDCGVDAVEGEAGAWVLKSGAHRFGPFAHIVFAMPPQQVRALLPAGAGFATALEVTHMLGCHTIMLGFTPSEAPEFDWQCAHFDDDILGFAAVNSSKPGRGEAFSLVLQTRHDWSQVHIEDDLEAVAAHVKARFAAKTQSKISASGYDRVHRWRYASTQTPAATPEQPYLLDIDQGLSAIGDWCGGSKVEQAFQSGTALAARLRG